MLSSGPGTGLQCYAKLITTPNTSSRKYTYAKETLVSFRG